MHLSRQDPDMKLKRFPLATLALSLVLLTTHVFAATATLPWKTWQDSHFAKAKKESRFILLDLEAVWCHWCHVMEQKTYSDPRVAALIAKHYIPVKVDQDARPDLGKRYEDYGWPATIVFDADGREIVKLRGFIPPERMVSILEAIVKDPSPIRYFDYLRDNPTEISGDAVLSTENRDELTARFYRTHDFSVGGLDQPQKFMDRDSVELALTLGHAGDKRAMQMARQTLDGALNLIDPAWGGAYQYSTDNDWNHHHFEKIMSVQADYLRLYANAWRQSHDARYLEAAKAIRRYVKNFLTSPEGVFYVSQDADLVQGEHSEDYFKLDDSARRALGVPRVDTHIYARENGWMISALVALSQTGSDAAALQDAMAAARWIEKHRSLPDGGFRHDSRDSAGPYLDDNLAMARAYLALYVASADRLWLTRAQRAAGFIARNFKADKGGFLTSAKRGKLQPRPNTDENIQTARLFNELSHYTGRKEFRKYAEHAMRYLVTDEIATYRRTEPGILLADREMSSDPTHITIVGGKRDTTALAFYRRALAFPAGYRRIEWWDRNEGRLPNPDVEYPALKRPAAFICTDKICSSPIYDEAEIEPTIQRLAGSKPEQ